MNNKKRIIIGIIVFAIFITGFMLLRSRPVVQSPSQKIRPTATPFVMITPTGVSLQKETLTLSGITVKNFYSDAVSINDEGDVLMKETDTYHLVYYPASESFLISVIGSPFEEARIQAEQAFLSTLGITQDQSCLLTAEVSTPQFANPDFAGKRFALSFCAHEP